MFNEREEEELGGGLEEWHHVVLQRSRGISERVLLSFKPGRKPIKTKAKKQMHLKWEQLGSSRQLDQAGMGVGLCWPAPAQAIAGSKARAYHVKWPKLQSCAEALQATVLL